MTLANRISRSQALRVSVVLLLFAVACGGAEGRVLLVGGIPDQDASRLARRYDSFAAYLSEQLDIKVSYVPSADYAAVVTAFGQGGLDLAFFGGFTGVQARLQNPGAEAIAQREQDAQFHTKFIVRANLPVDSLEDLARVASELTFTFGSESSTSGHLMPRHFLYEAGIDPDEGFRTIPNYSGSHDVTWRLVESGAFDVGALSEDVWARAVAEGRVDTAKVRELEATPAFPDYNWTARPDLDEEFGAGFTQEVQRALLALRIDDHAEILRLFSTDGFVPTESRNYQTIEDIARRMGYIE